MREDVLNEPPSRCDRLGAPGDELVDQGVLLLPRRRIVRALVAAEAEVISTEREVDVLGEPFNQPIDLRE
jgi:hypothetical protein